MTEGSWKSWALGVAGVIIVALFTISLNAYDSRIDELETQQSEINKFHIDGNERLVKLETHYQHIDEQLDRIEQKLNAPQGAGGR